MKVAKSTPLADRKKFRQINKKNNNKLGTTHKLINWV